MSQMSEALVSILWAAAIPHFFDEKVLAALRPELKDQSEALLVDLQLLTFVEEFPEHGYNVHELTREVLLNKLWERDQEEFLLLTKRAADYFFEERTLPAEDIEFAYHEALDEKSAQSGRLLSRVINWWDYYQTDRMQSVVQALLEHEKEGRLNIFGHSFLLYLTGLINNISANYKEAETLFNRALKVYKEHREQSPRYVAMLLRDLSISRYEQGNTQSAIPNGEQALKICREQLGDNHLDTSISLNNLADLYESQGRYDEAEPLYLEALAICKAELGNHHLYTASRMNNLAVL